MEYIADLHTHSPYSRATSPEGTPAGLAAWAAVKGITVVATGDFTHPAWFRTLRDELVEAEPGLLRLRDKGEVPCPLGVASGDPGRVRFLLSAEISGIYKRGGAVRKVHNLIYVPDFASAERLSAALAGLGNIESDGRPILGLDSRDLLEIVLEKAPEGFLVPAHVWTPWFSLFGSRSGFDTLEECFGDLTPHVFALETGLSSDPAMNRLLSGLDRLALISNSDCHSPSRLGREANVFNTGLDFYSLAGAIRSNRRDSFRGTIEFFPEEGKYHADGHRACGVCLAPQETRELGAVCPVCKRPLTVGVLHRVLELADRQRPFFGEEAPEVFQVIPLAEIIGEILGTGPSSKKALELYGRLIRRFGSEFDLLLKAPLEELRGEGEVLAEAVSRLRRGEVIRRPGFDGQFGVIRLFQEGELARMGGQGSLFGEGRARRPAAKNEPSIPLAPAKREEAAPLPVPEKGGPNEEQAAAISAGGRHVLVAAGPGTGKTYTLVGRAAAILKAGCEPRRLAAITFTVKAADEVRTRLIAAAGKEAGAVFVGTFHQFCLSWLRKASPGLSVAGPEDRERILRRLHPELSPGKRQELKSRIEASFHDAAPGEDQAIASYLAELRRLGAVDLEEVIPRFVRLLQEDEALRREVQASLEHLLVDEFQDLNESQFELVRILAEGCHCFAIGDPNQAIYGFRGSAPRYFRLFAGLPGVEQVFLTRNYRSAPIIVEAAAALISRNGASGAPPLCAVSRRPGAIELHEAPTEAAEAEFIVRRIEELMGGIESFSLASGRGGEGAGTLGFGDIAVLYRLGRQAQDLADALARRGIPCQLVGATPFYLAAELRPVYYFLQAAAGSPVTAEWLCLVEHLPGVGRAALRQLEENLPLAGDFRQGAAAAALPGPARDALSELEQRIAAFLEEVARQGIAAALAQVLPFLHVDGATEKAGRLLALAGAFGRDLSAFAEHLKRHAEASVYDERAEAVALMTIHSAKGLEFSVVFLTGAEEGLLPCRLWQDVDLHEERRLFYVAMTRAKERLILSAARTRPWVGPSPRPLSPFVGELPAGLVTAAPGAPFRSKRGRGGAAQMELF